MILHRDEKGRIKKHKDIKIDWHKDRFVFREGTVEKICTECGIKFYLPKSKEKNQERCGIECSRKYREKQKLLKERICPTCKSVFYPRKSQIDSNRLLYCSHKCQGESVFGDKNQAWNGGVKSTFRRYRTKRREAIRPFNRITNAEIKNLGDKQKWKCAICKIDIRKMFHKDHIISLAKGGPHIISNIQLLCKPCNCKKYSKDPIDYMQSLGYLL